MEKAQFQFNPLSQGTCPPYVLDMADEKGMFIMWESALYSRGYMTGVDMPKYSGIPKYG